MSTPPLGIFFGSTTGNTERIAYQLQCLCAPAHVYDIAQVGPETLRPYPVLLFGISTWYEGEMQGDWADFMPHLRQVDFQGKAVALFGCGDQIDYASHFCSGMRLLYDALQQQQVRVIGRWWDAHYSPIRSSVALNPETLVGLALDEDHQAALTPDRLNRWVAQWRRELAP